MTVTMTKIFVPICLYCLNFTKIIKIVAIRCQILRLKCTEFDFGWGSAPHPAGGAYSAPPDLLAGFKGPTSKGIEEGDEKGKDRDRRGEGNGRGLGCPLALPPNPVLPRNAEFLD